MAAETAMLLDRNSLRPGLESVQCDGVPTAALVPPADGTARIFWMFVGWHVVLWTAVQALTAPNRPLDMVEMLYWGHHWQWGYHKHPPLPAWIAEAVFQLSAGLVWPLYLVAPLAVAVSFWAAWTLAKEFLKPWPALCASTLLEACAYYNYTTADLNHTIVLQPLWALSGLCLYRAITRKRLHYWAATGLCLGLGMLTKYDMAVLVICMLLLPVINRKARAALLTPGPYLTLSISLLVFAPHLAWMIEHHFSTVLYAVERSETTRSFRHVINPIEFALSQILALLPMLAISFPLWRRGQEREAQPVDRDELRRDFLMLICFGPFVLDLVLSAATGVQIQSMWGASMWTFSGLCLALYAGVAADASVYRTVIWRCALAGLLVVLILVTRNVASPYLRHKASRVHFPGNQLAGVVQLEWQRRTERPIAVVAGPWWVAANVGLSIHGRPQIYDFVYPDASPWSDDEVLRKLGGVIVWEFDDDGAKCAQQVRFRFPDAEILSPFALKWQTSADIPPVQFGLAIVLPTTVASAGIGTE
ncbi:MAG: glycosyltransferase family 39 protein [Planctomycetia bacterium]|nr:glycosyltransferase family 39 protein [Planctomycetia bacterium]